MFTVSVINQKGGTGKTTVAVNIAAAFALEGQRVLVMDGDHAAQSANLWVAARTLPPIVDIWKAPSAKDGESGIALAEHHAANRRRYDVVVIDGPPRADAITAHALLCSNVAIVPVQPSAADLWAAEAILPILAKAGAANRRLKTAFMLNRVPSRAKIGAESAEYLAAFGLPVLPSLPQRVAYAVAYEQGRGVIETDAKAGADVLTLVAAIRAL